MSAARRACLLFLIALLCLSALALTSCRTAERSGTDSPPQSSENTQNNNGETNMDGYTCITPEQAKQIMDSAEYPFIILDVRTLEEYDEGHIENAILIPYDEIDASIAETLPDRDVTILVYCRSGRRSKIAAAALAELGYTNVLEFGGIIDWPYETVK